MNTSETMRLQNAIKDLSYTTILYNAIHNYDNNTYAGKKDLLWMTNCQNYIRLEM